MNLLNKALNIGVGGERVKKPQRHLICFLSPGFYLSCFISRISVGDKCAIAWQVNMHIWALVHGMQGTVVMIH